MVIFRINIIKPKINVTFRRDWRHYSKDKLCDELCSIDWSTDIDDVQGFWNDFECKFIDVVDKIVPITKFENNIAKVPLPKVIKNKLNIRNRLLRKRFTYSMEKFPFNG